MQEQAQIYISNSANALADKKDEEADWKDINELRTTDRDYSGLKYSYEYIQNNKQEQDIYYGTGKWLKAVVAEQIELKRAKDGSIKYRVTGRDVEMSSERNFNTQYGIFRSIDKGEFGSSIKLPNGKEITGNFKYVFDVGDKVYAISSLAHMMLANTCIYQIDKNLEYTKVYITVDEISAFIDSLEDNEYTPIENLDCEAVDINEKEAYALLAGYIEKTDESDKTTYWDEVRILQLTEDGVKEINRYVGKIPISVKSLIVNENDIYISCDKMVIQIERDSNKLKYLTYITKEDEEELLKNVKNND